MNLYTAEKPTIDNSMLDASLIVQISDHCPHLALFCLISRCLQSQALMISSGSFYLGHIICHILFMLNMLNMWV